MIFHGDVDGSGTAQIVEAKYEGDILVPRRGYSCSSTAMPSLKGKLKSYRTFAGSTLSQVYSDDLLSKARKFSVTTLESGVFLNDGKGRYTFRPLPRAVQIAPVHGLAAIDADADGRPDLVLAQNFWHPQRETGRMAGGTGLVLKGAGDGSFAPLTIAQSGVLIPGDARGLITADFNGDSQPDFAVAENNGPARAFLGKSATPRTTVRLKGRKGNPQAIGARITLTAPGMAPQTAEVSAGGSWFSQNSSSANFTVPAATKEVKLTIRWAGGRVTQHIQKPGALEITQPSGK